MLKLARISPWSTAVQIACTLGAAAYVLNGRGLRTARAYLRLASLLVVVLTFTQVPLSLPASELLEQTAQTYGRRLNIGFGLPILLFVLVFHLTACLVIPWRPLEALVPIAPIVAVYLCLSAIEFLGGGSDVFMLMVVGCALALAIAPGFLVCLIRSKWFTVSSTGLVYRERYEEIAGELDLARRIHERLLPARITDGAVQVDYVFEPMRSIGGDLLYLRKTVADANSPLHVIMVDVTGHGIAAALAVNRLHGELGRIFGVHRDPSPGQVLRELNRYIEVTMAGESMYATALCLKIDPEAAMLRWASAAHPPAFLASVSGIRDLDATTTILGAIPDEEFDPEEQAIPLAAGNSLLAYTDGAFEVWTESGRLLGLAGLRQIAAASEPARAGWAQRVRSAAMADRKGAATDDVLIAQLTFR